MDECGWIIYTLLWLNLNMCAFIKSTFGNHAFSLSLFRRCRWCLWVTSVILRMSALLARIRVRVSPRWVFQSEWVRNRKKESERESVCKYVCACISYCVCVCVCVCVWKVLHVYLLITVHLRCLADALSWRHQPKTRSMSMRCVGRNTQKHFT